MILVTTSDYFPQLGGLSTFTDNIEKSLKEIGVSYDLFHWKSFEQIKNAPDLSKYEFIINVHPQFAWMTNSYHEKMVNFIHGSEILMTSPSLVKHIYKRMNRRKFLTKLEASHLNVFISNATQNKAIGQGYRLDYSRDIILHNCIDIKDAEFVKHEVKNHLVFTCIVRNVPHKNLAGSLGFCEMTAKLTGRKVELIVPKGSGITSDTILVTELKDHSNSERDEAYKRSHYNLLLSLDHSSKGFFEGFGLTVLEAARFGTPSVVMDTGGLAESVHHADTGWVISKVDVDTVAEIFSKENEYRYYQMVIDCYEHTRRSHSLQEYCKLLNVLLDKRRAA